MNCWFKVGRSSAVGWGGRITSCRPLLKRVLGFPRELLRVVCWGVFIGGRLAAPESCASALPWAVLSWDSSSDVVALVEGLSWDAVSSSTVLIFDNLTFGYMTSSLSSVSIRLTSLALMNSSLVSSSGTGLGLTNGGSVSGGVVAGPHGVPAAGPGTGDAVNRVVGDLDVALLVELGVGLCDTLALLK